MGAKRGNGEGSIGQYNGRWVARYVGAAGQRKAIYGSTRAEVAQKLAAGIRDRDAGLSVPDEHTTLGSFLKQWLEQSVRPRNRPSTYAAYSSHVRTHLIPHLGAVRLAKLSPSDVERFLASRLSVGLTPTTVVRIRATLRRALAVALRQGLVSRNVAALVDPPRQQPKKVTVLSTEEARSFLRAVDGHRYGPLFVLAIATGMRQGELLGLQWHNVDLPGARLTVMHALQRVAGTFVLVEPKTMRSLRTVTVPPIALQLLQGLQAWQAGMRVTHTKDWNPLNLVFTAPSGKPLDGSNVTHALQRLMSEAALPHIRFHDLRHTCASLLLAQGTHMRVIMEQLGHSQISLTMNTYSHVMPEAMQDAADKLQQVLSGSPTPT